VGIFAPLKNAWRKVLEDYKRKNPKEAGISKSEFPALLARQGSTYILENLALGGKNMKRRREKRGNVKEK
jgi:hypothetical protein